MTTQLDRDVRRYKQLVQDFKWAQKAGMERLASDLWKSIELLKAKYGGHIPGQKGETK